MSFTMACQLAIDEIKAKYLDGIPAALTYMFIDESQDFDDTFFELCDLVTEKNIFIAGDIFQSIFDENISNTIEPDFLLGKCYRTDPKTLMFAHGLGMGLFEETKLRWLEEKEWKDCGYNVEVRDSVYHLSREPLKRFEDLDDNFESLRIIEIDRSFSDTVIQTIREIIKENDTVKPEDIGIILLDSSRSIYELADLIELKIQKEFEWSVNKAYETKERLPDTILISNRNNVKGLEFPFVICVTRKITNNPSYRNSLYTMLTRSFIKSFFLTQPRKKIRSNRRYVRRIKAYSFTSRNGNSRTFRSGKRNNSN
jgi:superfamily I DNA and RNA helicase